MINTPTLGRDLWPVPIDFYPEEDQARYYNDRRKAYEQLIFIEFQLAYHAHISIRDIDDMPSYERLEFYKNLKNQKEAEQEAAKEATSKSHTKGR